MISIKQIRYALAVERHLHFRKAAEDSSVSQSALSTALNEMENQLGFQVFERDNKKVLVTPMGRLFLDKARQVNLQIDDMMRLKQTDQSPLSSSISVGMIPTIAPYLLPIGLAEVKTQYPDAKLRIREAKTRDLLELVRLGEIDTAVIALPYDCEGLLTFPFWSEDFYWVFNKGRVETIPERITSNELVHENLMLLSEGHCMKDHALAACRWQDSTTHSMSATSLNTLVQLVISGMGSTLVPEIALNQLVSRDDRLGVARLDEPGPHRELAFVVRATYPNLASVEVLRTQFKKALANALSR